MVAQGLVRSTRVAPGRFEYSGGEFFILALGLAALTIVGLFVARIVRDNRDARLSDSSGGWRIRSQFDLDLPDPYCRFSGLALEGPHNAMEGTEQGFEVAYFEVTVGRRPPVVRPCAIVQLPDDPPRTRVDAVHGRPHASALSAWGPAARAVLAEVQNVTIETAPLALLVRSTGAPSEAVSRTALALAKALGEDARRTSGR